MVNTRLINLARANYALVETLYERYKRNPKSVSPDWIEVFEALELMPESLPKNVMREKIRAPIEGPDECRIARLIDAFRCYGYLGAPINPIARQPPQLPPEIALETLGFKESDLTQQFPTCQLLKSQQAPLLEILQTLRKIYTERIGFEYMGVHSLALEQWLQEKIESNHLQISLSIEQKQRILEQLNKSELFEAFLHVKFTGQKRFSIEGGETFICLLEELIEKSAELGGEEFVLGMTHRGRLNVLVNILNKSFVDVFSEFDEGYFPDSFEGSGDVKYHKGFLSEARTIQGHSVTISLTPNPSHLESVDAVVEGQVKARQIKRKDSQQAKAIAILVHGDAAIAGQGVVYETLQLSKLKGYSTGGTLHIVINNQIGFTTLPEDTRSTMYCTDIAKAFGCPVFHVNAEDPEACVYVAQLAAEIRHLFHIDVFIDLNCYRKYGHNEGDEPAFTQPIEYQMIRTKKTIREIYRDQLIHQGIVEKFMAESLEVEFKKALQDAQRAAKTVETPKSKDANGDSSKLNVFKLIQTGVSQDLLIKIMERYCDIPKDFQPHQKLQQLLKERLNMVVKDEVSIDWGTAEILAYGSLLWTGTPLRLSGQDSGRGTFSHRHALWMDQVAERAYFPLSFLKEGQARSDVINSPLSEFGVLGFEYGYSIAYPETLVIWEAQFGDFCNEAQVVIDQYISSGEQKWGQKSSLTLLLPHGYEGQGPEHSSARLERFLSLAGNDNMFICYPSTPAQFFHLIRRQSLGGFNKPLICLTPKQLLRHPECVSTKEAFVEGYFEEVLDDPLTPLQATCLVFCSGKIFYEISQLRSKENSQDLAIIRIEELYPLHEKRISEILKIYSQSKRYIWMQEEPKNMGAWNYIAPLLQLLLPKGATLEYAGRSQSASPATGSYVVHKKELAQIFKSLMIKKDPNLQISHFHRA